MELVRESVKVRLSDRGEGIFGKFDPQKAGDVPLLSVEIFTTEDGDFDHEDAVEWFKVPGHSVCTLLPTTISEEEKTRVLEMMMEPVFSAHVLGYGMKAVMSLIAYASLASLKDGVISPTWPVNDYSLKDGKYVFEVDERPQG